MMTHPPSDPSHGAIEHTREFLYDEWKRYGRHLEEYACEFLGTTLLMICLVGIVAMMFGASSPVSQKIASLPLKMLLAGCLVGLSVCLIAISPLGRLSGAHINPAVTFGFYLLGKMHLKDTIGYVASQMAGALLGTAIAVRLFGKTVTEVHSAALGPGPHIGIAAALSGEILTTFLLTLLIYTFVSQKTLAPWTPLALIPAIAMLVFVDGPISGAGFNPARWFGSALVANLWELAWVYFVGPFLGTYAAVLLHKSGVLTHPLPHTGKLFHDVRYRSIFKHDKLPSRSHLDTELPAP